MGDSSYFVLSKKYKKHFKSGNLYDKTIMMKAISKVNFAIAEINNFNDLI